MIDGIQVTLAEPGILRRGGMVFKKLDDPRPNRGAGEGKNGAESPHLMLIAH